MLQRYKKWFACFLFLLTGTVHAANPVCLELTSNHTRSVVTPYEDSDWVAWVNYVLNGIPADPSEHRYSTIKVLNLRLDFPQAPNFSGNTSTVLSGRACWQGTGYWSNCFPISGNAISNSGDLRISLRGSSTFNNDPDPPLFLSNLLVFDVDPTWISKKIANNLLRIGEDAIDVIYMGKISPTSSCP